MNNKLMVGVLAFTLVAGGIVGATFLPSTNAATSATVVAGTSDNKDQVNQDNDEEVNDDAEDIIPTPALSQQQSIDIAIKKTPGKVIDAKLESEDGKAVFEITINDSAGKEHEVTVDANTGMIVQEND